MSGFFGSLIAGATRFVTSGRATAVVAGNFAISAGWGTGATVSAVSGNEVAGTVTVTPGTTPSANPTITFTYPGGAYAAAPTVLCCVSAGSISAAQAVLVAAGASSVVFTPQITPTNGLTNTYTFMVIG